MQPPRLGLIFQGRGWPYAYDLVAFIDRNATEDKLSRSARMSGSLRNMQLMDSLASKKALAQCLVEVMAEKALQSGLPVEQVRKTFPQLDAPRALEHADPATQLPAAGDAHADAPATSPSTSALDSAPVALPATRRRPYQRAKRPAKQEP